MSRPEIDPIWRWLIFAGIFFGAGWLVFIAARHEVAAHWAASSDAETRLRAAASEPENAELWYQLGRYRQFDFEHSDLPLAISYYQRAISINPASPFYWMDLASAYETAGNIAQAEQAYRKARQFYPVSAEAAWRFGNFLLRQGRTPQAFPQIREAVVIDPKLAALAVSRAWRSTQDVEQILSSVLPDNQDVNWAAAQFFVQEREPVPGMAVWKRITAHHASFPASNAFPLLDMLIETGMRDDAQVVWKEALVAAGIPERVNTGSSLISNGGFEQPPLNGGFDWRIVPVEGAKMGWDEQIVHSGKRSLRVDFDGSANVDFQSLWEYVPVEPATLYRLSAFFRTENLSTDSGIRFEIRDGSRPGNTARWTENLLGTHPWGEADAEFATGPDTKHLKIVLRRIRSEKLANKLRGMAWVDDVALVPLSRILRSPR